MNAVILSCTTLLEYVQIAQEICKTDFPVLVLDRQYHIEPSEMREHILLTLAGLAPEVDTVLVAMGFCGGSWQDIVFDMYFEHYYHLDIIDNGLYDCYDPDYVERAQKDADRMHAELDFVPGSNLLLEKLVSGKWDEQFYVVPPDTVITQGKFFER